MTGLSGSGKSSLAFDTIYADGQRRYVESLSSYARMFLGQMEKPDVDEITGLSPGHFHRPEDHQPQPPFHRGHRDGDLRLSASAVRPRRRAPLPGLRQGQISQQTVDEMVDAVMAGRGHPHSGAGPGGARRKGTQQKELDAARRAGYARVRVDGNLYDLTRRSSWKRTRSTPWRSWWTVLPCARASAAVWRTRWRPRWR